MGSIPGQVESNSVATTDLCCPGAKLRRWTLHLLHTSAHYCEHRVNSPAASACITIRSSLLNLNIVSMTGTRCFLSSQGGRVRNLYTTFFKYSMFDTDLSRSYNDATINGGLVWWTQHHRCDRSWF